MTGHRETIMAHNAAADARQALEAAHAHILDAYRVLQADDISAIPPSGSSAGKALALISAALSSPIDQAEVEALVKPSIDTMREAAWEVLRKNGWEATARLSLHQVSGLMAQFGMNVSAGEVGCGYPDCGCCDDVACEDAIKQHPDFAPALTPAEKAGVGDGDALSILEELSLPVVGTLFVARGCATARAYKELYDGPDEHSYLVRMSDVQKALEPLRAALSTTKPAQGDGE